MTLNELLEILICPAPECGRPIIAKPGDEHALQCTGCGRVYPIEDGIVIMLEEKARTDVATASAPSNTP